MDFHNKIVVVTGAGGSIGSEVCRQLLKAGVGRLRLLSLTESALYRITQELKDPRVQGYLGSVTDHKLLLELFYGADIVIHAAAHKHVPICEDNPLAAIETNVIGTAVLADAAKKCRVQNVVFISTDKAVKPSSIMGATKRFAELVIRDIADYRIFGRVQRFPGDTVFRIVRFGNVLDSDGSVLPLWRRQIAAGGPVTLTDRRCTRYFMSIPDAASLVLGVLDLEPVVGPFVFDMGEPKNMRDLAVETIYEVKGSYAFDIAIVETGLRPGEKLTEELTYGGSVHDTDNPKIKVIEEECTRRLPPHILHALVDATHARDRVNAKRILWEAM